MPALVVLVRYGADGRVVASAAYVIFALAPMWWTPHSGAAGDYGARGLITLVANSFLFAGMGVMAYICVRTWRPGSGSFRLRPRSADSSGIPASDWT
jgi:alpha-1,2-mannosyltransferase